MPPRRKLSRTPARKLAPIAADNSSSSSWPSIGFWALLLLLCAGGYLYYNYAQERNQEARAEQKERARAYHQKREENERNAGRLRSDARQRALEKQEEQARKLALQRAEEQACAEAEAELAAREAKEREAILAAEELEQLREQAEREQMLNPYRDEEPTEDENSSPLQNAVVAALGQFEVFNAKPREKADFYIYLCSASWCPNCIKEMPTVVAEFKKMRRARNVELVLISYDKSLLEAKAFPKKYKLKCPSLWVEDMRQKAFQRLPGFSDDGSGVPHVFIVDKDGRMITRGHGSIIKDWRYYTVDADKPAHE